MEPTNAQTKLQEGQKFLFDEPRDVKRAIEAFQETTKISPEWAEGLYG